jgi:hypothetical protein
MCQTRTLLVSMTVWSVGPDHRLVGVLAASVQILVLAHLQPRNATSVAVKTSLSKPARTYLEPNHIRFKLVIALPHTLLALRLGFRHVGTCLVFE